MQLFGRLYYYRGERLDCKVLCLSTPLDKKGTGVEPVSVWENRQMWFVSRWLFVQLRILPRADEEGGSRERPAGVVTDRHRPPAPSHNLLFLP